LGRPARGSRTDAQDIRGLQLHILNASTESEIDRAFGTLVDLHADALMVSVDPFSEAADAPDTSQAATVEGDCNR
jgi:hypothetical protein